MIKSSPKLLSEDSRNEIEPRERNVSPVAIFQYYIALAITENVFWDSTARYRLASQLIKQTGVGPGCQAYQLDDVCALVFV